MLTLRYNRLTGMRELRLYGVPVEARIVPLARAFPGAGRDWQLWVARAPGLPATVEKSPTRLLIESRLRAWLLRRFHRCLFALRFEELVQLASKSTPERSRQN